VNTRLFFYRAALSTSRITGLARLSVRPMVRLTALRLFRTRGKLLSNRHLAITTMLPPGEYKSDFFLLPNCFGVCFWTSVICLTDGTARDGASHGAKTGSRDCRSDGPRRAKFRRRQMRLTAAAQGKTVESSIRGVMAEGVKA